MRFSNKKLFIYEIKTTLHGAVVAAFNAEVSNLNIAVAGDLRSPFRICGSPSLCFEIVAMQPDLSFYNLLRPRIDLAVDQYPNFVLEVAYAESYDSAFSSVATYFSHPSIRVLVIVKLSYRRNRPVYAGRRVISQMIVCLYRAADWHNNRRPCQVISFGHQLHPTTAAQIIARTCVAEDAFVGVGRHANEIQCNAPNIGQNQLAIPGEDLWQEVLEGRPHPLPDLAIDLWYIKEFIQETGAIIDL